MQTQALSIELLETVKLSVGTVIATKVILLMWRTLTWCKMFPWYAMAVLAFLDIKVAELYTEVKAWTKNQ